MKVPKRFQTLPEGEWREKLVALLADEAQRIRAGDLAEVGAVSAGSKVQWILDEATTNWLDAIDLDGLGKLVAAELVARGKVTKKGEWVNGKVGDRFVAGDDKVVAKPKAVKKCRRS